MTDGQWLWGCSDSTELLQLCTIKPAAASWLTGKAAHLRCAWHSLRVHTGSSARASKIDGLAFWEHCNSSTAFLGIGSWQLKKKELNYKSSSLDLVDDPHSGHHLHHHLKLRCFWYGGRSYPKWQDEEFSISGDLGIQPLLHHTEMLQLRWFELFTPPGGRRQQDYRHFFTAWTMGNLF